ncbi:MAG: outer membrane protein assembly factor BamB [Burkholderiaceae bacterium]|jgi:outer membrane protein assembly factor BamB|nr:outer membrane protein assembly factor BamB [Burkholderiaceae bacterium]
MDVKQYRTFPSLVLLVAFVLSLSGCSWETVSPIIEKVNPFSSPPTRNLPAELTDLTPTRRLAESWSVRVGDSGNFMFVPVYTYDAVYAASAGGTLVRVDVETGREVWRVNAGRLTAGVGSDGRIVVVAGEKGTLLAYDADGQQKWKARLSSEALSSPVVGEGVVVVRSQDNRIAGFDAASGERKWMLQRRSPALMLRSSPGIVTVGPTAVVALPGGRMISLLLGNGATRWDAMVADPRGTTELERIADTSGTPAVYDRLVCASAFQGRIACFDVVTGRGVWAKEFSSDVGVGLDNQFVYAVNESSHVHAFSALRGQSVWRNERLSHRRLTTPIPFEGTVAVGDLQGFVHFLSREDGSFVARAATDGTPIRATPLVAGSRLIVQTTGGALQALMIN